MYEESPANQIHIQKYLFANCFGDCYTRKTLDVKTRHPFFFYDFIFCGCEPQLKGHIQNKLNVGNDKEILLKLHSYCRM
jgi:4-carboxymuconolactone decarboxylase